MISEAESQHDNPNKEYPTECLPEGLVVEKEYSPLKFKIVQAPERSGGYIITTCRNADWIFDLGARLDKEQQQRLSDWELKEKNMRDVACDKPRYNYSN
jgi:hypothetical protein